LFDDLVVAYFLGNPVPIFTISNGVQRCLKTVWRQ